MSDKPVRLGYVGCGFMAQNVHLPNFASLPECELVALAELRPKLGELVAERFGIPRVYRSHLELAENPEIDAVAVSGPQDLQGDVAADLLRAGKHVFMEKPMAVSVAQAERMLAAGEEGNARLTVAYMKRYDPGNELARATIAQWRESGERGRALYARGHCFGGNWVAGLDLSTTIATDEPVDRPWDAPDFRFGNLPDWMPEERGIGYVSYLENWSHNVNLLRYLLGVEDVPEVAAVDLDQDGKTGVVVLKFGDVRAVIESAWTQHHHWDDHTQVYFDQGWVRVEAPPFFVKPSQSKVEIYEGGEHHCYRYPLAEPFTAWPYREEAIAFLDSVRTGVPTRSSGEDTLAEVRLFEEIYRHDVGIPR